MMKHKRTVEISAGRADPRKLLQYEARNSSGYVERKAKGEWKWELLLSKKQKLGFEIQE